MGIQSNLRFDYMPVRSRKVTRTDEGYLSGSAAIAKVGVLTYRLTDGTTRKEFVPPETLFNEDSFASLRLKPITSAHPPEKLLDARSVKRRYVGTIGENVIREDDALVTSLIVMDSEAIKGVENGQHQLSPGYVCELEMIPGEHNGERYDAVQVKRSYNHVALVDSARGGADLKLHLDGMDDNVRLDGFEQISELLNDNKNPQHNQRSGRMLKKISLDGIEYEAAPEVLLRLDKMEKELVASEEALATVTAEVETVKADRDTIQTKLDEANARDIIGEAKAIAAARTKLEREASPYLTPEQLTKLDSMTDQEVRNAVILKAFPKAEAQLKDASDIYLTARYDSAVEILAEIPSDAFASQRKAVNGGVRTDKRDEVDQAAARKKMEEDAKNAYVSASAK